MIDDLYMQKQSVQLPKWRNRIQQLTATPLKMISVHITDYCNSKCDFCVVNSPITQTPIEVDHLIETVEKLGKEEDADILNIHGGEPTISKALFPVLKAGKGIGISEVHLQTNGIRLADRSFVDRLVDAGVSVFVISLHGHNKDQQEMITGTPKSFDKIVRGIRNCLDAGALVRSNSVICKQNVDTFYEVLALSCSLGIPWVNISALHPSKHAMSSFQSVVVHPEQLREVVPGAIQRLLIRYPETVVELEGFPPCHTPGLDDHHINVSLRQIRMSYHDQIFENYEDYMNETQRCLVAECAACSEVARCGGVYRPYTTEFESPVVWPRLAK